MSRLLLVLSLLLTHVFNPALADDHDDKGRSKQAVNQIQINGSNILIYGNELIKNKKDKVFFAAESSSEMIEVPFTEDGDDFLEVILPYEPSAGTYRLGIGKSQKQLRVSELITFVTDAPQTNKYTADCTEDSSAFTVFIESLDRSSDDVARVRVLGSCDVGGVDEFDYARLTFQGRRLEISGLDDNGQCTGRLVSDAEKLTITAREAASLRLVCIAIDVYGERVELSSNLGSQMYVAGVSAPLLELKSTFASSIAMAGAGAPIEVVIAKGNSSVYLINPNFIDGGGLFLENNSDFEELGGGTGSLRQVSIDNGSSADLGLPITRADVTFGSRLRATAPVLSLGVDDSSVAIVPPYDP